MHTIMSLRVGSVKGGKFLDCLRTVSFLRRTLRHVVSSLHATMPFFVQHCPLSEHNLHAVVGVECTYILHVLADHEVYSF